MATIGYGTSDIFFDDCLLQLILLSVHVCVRLIVDATVIGIIYCRLARPHARASTIIFSNKAVIRRIRGKLYFMFQLCELRKHQLVEAHVRLYAIRNEVDCQKSDCHSREDSNREIIANNDTKFRLSETVRDVENNYGSFTGPAKVDSNASCRERHLITPQLSDSAYSNRYKQTCSMRLNHPNDELGSMLLMMTPQMVVHELDASSPLMPPPTWALNFKSTSSDCMTWDPLCDSSNGTDRSNLDFPNPSYRPKSKHVPQTSSSDDWRSLDMKNRLELSRRQADEQRMLELFMNDRQMEIIAIVEGVDGTAGGNVQARHSYTCNEIDWHKCFRNCVFADADGVTAIDFSFFHDLIDVEKDAEHCGFTASRL